MSAAAETPAVLGVAEIADFLGIRRPNVRKMLARYEIEPVAELAVGPVYSRDAIAELKERWEADERAREADERRRETARAKREGA